jgi:hypothetical protein
MDFGKRAAARQAMAGITRDILAADPHPRPLVYQGPVDLYRQLGAYPPSPLYYPLHLYFPPEHNVSHLDTATEVRHMLAWKPSVVITFHDFPASEESRITAPLVRAYIEVYSRHKIDVWGCVRAQD